MKEGMIMEELVIPEVLAELMDTTHLLTQKEIFMHRNDPVSSPEVSPVRHQRRKQEIDSFQGELRKLKPPSFDGEREREDDVEAWFLGIRRYFQFHNYSSNQEARISTYHLHGKAAMWWDQLKQVEHMLMKVGSLGRSSRSTSRRSTYQRISMTIKCRSYLNSGWEA
jgi:hypothetical protein